MSNPPLTIRNNHSPLCGDPPIVDNSAGCVVAARAKPPKRDSVRHGRCRSSRRLQCAASATDPGSRKILLVIEMLLYFGQHSAFIHSDCCRIGDVQESFDRIGRATFMDSRQRYSERID